MVYERRMTKKAKAISEGALIGIVAPSSTFSREKFDAGIDVLKSHGFRVSFDSEIFGKEGYLSATDEIRAKGLTEILSNPEIDAVLFARGGYGLQRIMPMVAFDAFEKSPKPVVGCSDLTPLLNRLTSKFQIPTFYGPVVTLLSEKEPATEEWFWRALTSTDPLGKIPSGDATVIREGETAGPLVGGCLSLIHTSIGTDFSLNADGAILLIEDHGEPIYKYDRMLTHLKNAGLFQKASGIVFGSMKLSRENEREDQLQTMIRDLLSDFKGPIVMGLPIGHQSPFVTVPLGVETALVARDHSVILEFLENALV